MSAQGPPDTATLAEHLISDESPVSTPSHHTRQLQAGSSVRSTAPGKRFCARIGLANAARRTLGIALLFVTVLLFTASSFLGSVSPRQH